MIRCISLAVFAASVLMAADTASKAEQDVMAAMNSWKQAMLNRDAAALDKLYHPDLTYSHSNGRTENKTEAIEAATKGTNLTEAIEMSEMAVRVYGTTALVKGKVDIRTNNGSGVQSLRLSVLHVWLQTPRGWQLVARQSTRLNP